MECYTESSRPATFLFITALQLIYSYMPTFGTAKTEK
jgi:hypothetical protein